VYTFHFAGIPDKVFISVENDWAQPVPLAAITSLMPALSSLMLLPAFIKVFGTIA
jgi:hypothetical protein